MQSIDWSAVLRHSIGRLAIGAGLRAATAVTAPLVLALALDVRSLSWTSFGAFLVALGDPGGSDRARLRGTVALGVAGMVAVAVAALTGGYPVAAGAAMFACAVTGALALRRGRAAGLLGTLATEAFIVSLAAPAVDGVGEAIVRALAFGAGGGWAMILLTAVWPLRRTTPASDALSHAYSALAAYAHALADAARQPGAARDWYGLMVGRPGHARARLAAAAALMPDEASSSRPGADRRLAVLAAAAEEAFALQLALADVLDPTTAAAAPTSEALAAALEEVEARLHGLGACVRTQTELAARPRPPLPPHPDGPLTGLMVRLAECLDGAELAAAARPVASAEMMVTGAHDVPRPTAPTFARVLTSASDPWTARIGRWWSDPVSRHALRLGTLTAAIVWGGGMLALERLQWVTLTILFTLQPFASSTWSMTRGRVLGTASGALLLTLIGGGGPLLLCVGVFALAAAGVAVLGVSYAAFCVFLTPLAILLVDPVGAASGGLGTWHLAAVRVVNTCIGGALSIAAMRALWPEPEHTYLRARIADVVLAIRDYLHTALVARRSSAPADVADSLRRVGESVLAAEHRLIAALGHDDGAEVRALSNLLERLQRLTIAINGLTRTQASAGPGDGDSQASATEAGAWRAAVAGWYVLHQAAVAVRGGHAIDRDDEPVIEDVAPPCLHRFPEHIAGVRAAVGHAALAAAPRRAGWERAARVSPYVPAHDQRAMDSPRSAAWPGVARAGRIGAPAAPRGASRPVRRE